MRFSWNSRRLLASFTKGRKIFEVIRKGFTEIRRYDMATPIEIAALSPISASAMDPYHQNLSSLFSS